MEFIISYIHSIHIHILIGCIKIKKKSIYELMTSLVQWVGWKINVEGERRNQKNQSKSIDNIYKFLITFPLVHFYFNL